MAFTFIQQQYFICMQLYMTIQSLHFTYYGFFTGANNIPLWMLDVSIESVMLKHIESICLRCYLLDLYLYTVCIFVSMQR